MVSTCHLLVLTNYLGMGGEQTDRFSPSHSSASKHANSIAYNLTSVPNKGVLCCMYAVTMLRYMVQWGTMENEII